MEQLLSYQKEKFLSICSQHDYDLLTGVITMCIKDFERLTYILMALGYSSYQQALERQYPQFDKALAEQSEREADILEVYPEYYQDEDMYGKYEQWIREFVSHIPSQERAYYEELIKMNKE